MEHGFRSPSFPPFRSEGVIPAPVIVGVALPEMFCGCRVDSATGIGVFPIVGVLNPVPSPGARGMTLGLSSFLLLRLATSGILSKASLSIHTFAQSPHPPQRYSLRRSLATRRLVYISQDFLVQCTQVPSMHALLISSAVLTEVGKNPSLPGTLGPPQQSSEC